MMILNHKESIEDKVYDLGDIYKRSKALILSESDLKCLIYHKLLEIDELAKLRSTNEENYLSNSIDVFCYFVIFNRYNNICDEFEQFLIENKESSQHQIIYISGEISN